MRMPGPKASGEEPSLTDNAGLCPAVCPKRMNSGHFVPPIAASGQ